jgi:hypothetical protein
MQAGRAAALLGAALAFLLFSLSLGAGEPKGKRRSILYPSDLGPESVDVSGYPKRLKEIYAKVLPGKCMGCHSLARALNAPLAELSEEEELAERALNPGLFEPGVLKSSPEAWKIYIKRMFMRPACCGSCGVWSKDELRQVHEFLRYDSRRRKTGAAAPAWIALRKKLSQDFKDLQANPLQEHP